MTVYFVGALADQRFGDARDVVCRPQVLVRQPALLPVLWAQSSAHCPAQRRVANRAIYRVYAQYCTVSDIPDHLMLSVTLCEYL